MKPRVKNSLNANEFEKTYEKGGGISMTVPDQSMSLKEILDRFARGLPVTGARVPMYDEEDDMPDIRTLDLAERQEYAEHFKRELTDIHQRQNASPEQYAPTAPSSNTGTQDASQPPIS